MTRNKTVCEALIAFKTLHDAEMFLKENKFAINSRTNNKTVTEYRTSEIYPTNEFTGFECVVGLWYTHTVANGPKASNARRDCFNFIGTAHGCENDKQGKSGVICEVHKLVSFTVPEFEPVEKPLEDGDLMVAGITIPASYDIVRAPHREQVRRILP